MMKYAVLLLLSSAITVIVKAQSIEDFDKYLSTTNQVLFVTTPSATSVQGTLFLYDRRNSRKRWKLKDSFAVVIGRSGLAKDMQTQISFVTNLPVKKEGDGKSPAGIFPLGNVFSYHNIKHLHMPFKRVDTLCYCVDDSTSTYYNKLIVSDTAQHNYNSFEHMRRRDDLYEYGIWVLYNSNPVIAGSGSCIFIHVWKDENSSTSGCTAMSKESILTLIGWLNKKKNPLLLQVVSVEK